MLRYDISRPGEVMIYIPLDLLSWATTVTVAVIDTIPSILLLYPPPLL